MSSNKETGDEGEEEVVKKVKCPNCKNKLTQLPRNYPLYDVQCTRCSFRAQIKTFNKKPSSSTLGAGWDIMEKVLKVGYLVPPLILNFKWKEKEENHQVIRFYPFIPKLNLKNYRLSPTARRANYRMFRYEGMDKLPYFTLYPK